MRAGDAGDELDEPAINGDDAVLLIEGVHVAVPHPADVADLAAVGGEVHHDVAAEVAEAAPVDGDVLAVGADFKISDCGAAPGDEGELLEPLGGPVHAPNVGLVDEQQELAVAGVFQVAGLEIAIEERLDGFGGELVAPRSAAVADEKLFAVWRPKGSAPETAVVSLLLFLLLGCRLGSRVA